MKRSFIREILEHTSSETISFAGGLPDVSLFPREALQSATHTALENAESLQYGTSTGYAPLKEQIAGHYCKRGFPTTPENIFITSGSQQGLDIICRYHYGASITIEKPSYLGAFNIFKLNNMKEYSVPIAVDGIELEGFRKSIAKSKLAYLIPDFQNPSARCYSDEHRKEIADIIRESQTLLIEDAPYSELYFHAPHKSISQMLPKQSYHLGSFSKVLSPALRVGWIRADVELLTPLIAYKEAMDLHTSGITQRMVWEYLKDGTLYEKHLQTLRVAYQEKMRYFSKQLDLHLPSFEYTQPKGGMFIYGRFKGVDTRALVQECPNHEIEIPPSK